MGKRGMKILITVALVALVVVSWKEMFDTTNALQNEYDGYLENARDKRDKELNGEALDFYNAALSMHDSVELRDEIAEFYYSINSLKKYVNFCEETMSVYPYDETAYIRMAEYYSGTKNYVSCFNVLNMASKRGLDSDRLLEIRNEFQYEYEYIKYGYEEVSIFSNGVCAVKRTGSNWGFVDSYGTIKLGFNYRKASDYNGAYVAVQLESGEYAFIELTGRQKSKTTNNYNVEECLYLFEDKVATKYDGKYHYCNFEFEELFGSFDYAGTFSGGVAAAMNDGKWFIIDSNGSQVGEKVYEEIKVDEKGVAFRKGVAFAKENGKYILIDSTGKQIGNDSWIDVDCFNSGQPAAVSNGESWGYVDITGQLIIDYQYDNAKSFSNDFAAVNIEGKWGYIELEDNSLKIDCQFIDAMDFSPRGTAFVKLHDGWDLIKFYSYN